MMETIVAVDMIFRPEEWGLSDEDYTNRILDSAISHLVLKAISQGIFHAKFIIEFRTADNIISFVLDGGPTSEYRIPVRESYLVRTILAARRLLKGN